MMTTVSSTDMDPSALALKSLVSLLPVLRFLSKLVKLFLREALFIFFSEGIEKVEIVQMNNNLIATPGKNTNVLDITVTCQGR